MKSLMMKKKIEILERSFAASAGAYYSINLTKDLVPGTMYQVIDDKEYSINEQVGLPNDAPFSAVVAYWGKKLPDNERAAYNEFFDIKHLLERFHNGESHVYHRYWTKSALFEPMFAEQHIVMYKDDESDDVLAITYVLDLTQKYREEQYKIALEEEHKQLKKDLEDEKKAREYEEIQKSLAILSGAIRNISFLDGISTFEELFATLPDMLASMGKFAKADRAYIFDLIPGTNHAVKMISEWCADGVRPTMEEMQNIAFDDMPNWLPKLMAGDAVISYDWDAERASQPEEYALFDGQDIHSLIVIPLISGGSLKGYMGYDNPSENNYAISLQILKAIGGHIVSLRENIRMRMQLEEKQRALEENLKELNQEKRILGALSVDYSAVSLCDFDNDTLYHLKEDENSNLPEINRVIGGENHSFSQRVRYYYDNYIVKDSAPDFLDKINLAYLRKYLKDHDRFAYPYRAKPNPAGHQYFEVQIVPLRGSSKFVMGYRYMDDIMEERGRQKDRLETALAEAKKASIAKTDFLRRMSHDIRTPINGIRGMISIAEHYPDDAEKQRECRAKVMKASGFLLELVNGVLDMNRLESGAVALKEVSFDMKDILTETMNIIQMQAQEYALSLECAPLNIKHRYLIGSPLHIRQVLQNVAGNAIKYNRAGGKIGFTCDEVSDDGKKACFVITCEDNGRGMSREFLKHAFEPFAQEDDGARTTYSGTGLGLAITEQLIRLMGGSIHIDSELGEGTKVTMGFVFDIDKNREPQPEDSNDVSEISLAGLKVLLVEDNDLNMEIAEFLLKKSGMEVTAAWNGAEATEIFADSEEGCFDLILMDIMMPVMNGLEAARAIRAMKRSDAKKIPIFAMTANAFPDDIKQSMDAGMNEHISKPLQEKEIVSVIRRYYKK